MYAITYINEKSGTLIEVILHTDQNYSNIGIKSKENKMRYRMFPSTNVDILKEEIMQLYEKRR